jgi:hypothetical protein
MRSFLGGVPFLMEQETCALIFFFQNHAVKLCTGSPCPKENNPPPQIGHHM